jgi:hypothetical protein
MLTAKCPNSQDHKEFITVAHVSEDWVVDEHGNFIEVFEAGEVVSKPRPGNTWTCKTWGAEAVVT